MIKQRATTPDYLVGIDLGTTHTVVAYTPLKSGEVPRIELFPIDQLTGPGEIGSRALLPSARYQASDDELTERDAALPWEVAQHSSAKGRPVVGELARQLGMKTPGRLIISAKSWLSHPTADRAANILPWGAPEGVPRISPVEASASYLDQVRSAWNHHHPKAPLELQELVITVPASFDEDARALTLEAARRAGLTRLCLLEEPQAVCYDWIWQHRMVQKSALGDARLLLVVDIGGGTLDLTLIRVEGAEEPPRLTRIAVGNHLMLGGDNIDLALAHRIEPRIVEKGKRLSAAELSQLVEQCRIAKERLLAEGAPDRIKVTLLGIGSRLVGAARSAELEQSEVRELVLEGFFPIVPISEHPERRRSAVVEFGLPYVSDPAVTRHLAAFLSEHRHASREALDDPSVEIPIPDALLLNGGLFQSPRVVQRLIEQITHWGGEKPTLLKNAHPEQAVAHGAVAYGMARRGQSLQRITGGTARSYFLRIETGESETTQGICILPRGTEEGHEIVLDRHFLLTLGVPVRFNLVAATDDRRPQPGELVTLDEDHFRSLPPLAAALDRSTQDQACEQPVRLAAALSEIGTLDLHCVDVDDPERRWSLEFQLRGVVTHASLNELPAHPNLESAREAIRAVFGKKSRGADPKAVKGLRTQLERVLGPRLQWETPLLRELFNTLLEGLPNRRRSADHERLWCNLTGFTLRPGFGYPLDEWRVEQIFAIHDQGLQFVNEAQNWAEWWTLWRRIAGGLGEVAQTTLFAELAEFINPETARRGNLPAQAKKRGYEDMLRLAATLERLPVQTKVKLGGWIVERLTKPNEPAESWWALGRIGGRIPFHGSAHNVVPRETAEAWLIAALQRDFRKEPHPAFAAVCLARMTGDRERDIGDSLRQQLLERLQQGRAPESWSNLVRECHELNESDEKRIFGEALPPGLKLVG